MESDFFSAYHMLFLVADDILFYLFVFLFAVVFFLLVFIIYDSGKGCNTEVARAFNLNFTVTQLTTTS